VRLPARIRSRDIATDRAADELSYAKLQIVYLKFLGFLLKSPTIIVRTEIVIFLLKNI
jgi:hypothetical protein